MKQILIVAATAAEIGPLCEYLKIDFPLNGTLVSIQHHQCQLHVLVTGIGMVNTAYHMGKYHQHTFDLVLNAGIAGAFQNNLQIGETVLVTKDTLSEMGAENGDEFILFENLQLPGTNIYTGNYHNEYDSLNSLKKVNGISVNTVHGEDQSILKCMRLFKADIESMEGAAFFMGAQNKAPIVIQLRTVSNYIEKRNKDNWQIGLAIKNLNSVLITLINQL